MMADFLAHSTFMMHDRAPALGAPIASTIPIGRKESAVTHLTFKPGGLAELKTALIDQLKATRRERAANAASAEIKNFAPRENGSKIAGFERSA
jgi:hypothetical protein